MHASLESLETEVLAKIPTLSSESGLFDYKNSVLGKDGSLTEILKGIRTLPDEQKKSFGKESNELKTKLTDLFEKRLATIRLTETNNKLRDEYADVTIPTAEPSIKHTNPITGVLRQVEDSFKRMGFDVYQSDEVTTEYWNFDSLNIPTSHPARDMQDTFWLE
jgi:phenylalanyl-tRNA synthetase alpha chain